MLSSVEARFKHEAAYDSTCVGRRFIGSVPRVDTLVLSHLPLQERFPQKVKPRITMRPRQAA